MILFLNNFCFFQEKIIVGKVLNSENNEALPYANIGIEKKSVGTVSDFSGTFSLRKFN